MRYQGGFLTASYFPLLVPDAPTIGTATASAGQVSTTFTAPANIGGGAITSYIAVAKDSSSGAVFTNTGASSPIVVTGLTNGNTYTVTVAATNAYGTGPRSAASNSVTPVYSGPSTVEYLVVAGGGGGGNRVYSAAGGGGGAGGYRTASGFSVASGSPITVTVGAGGASQVSGNDSVFSTISSAGGGKGGFYTGGGTSNASAGGSGGGGNGSNTGDNVAGAGNTPSTSPSQGSNGGNGFNSSDFSAGGGGGASNVGSAGTINTGGSGGGGTASSISGSSVTYAGGGGGGRGSNNVGSAGTGGSGGGGNGGSQSSGSNATTNTGGGGGGAAGGGTYVGGSGGSGIVIIRYADSFSAASATTGSPTITVAGGYRVYQWTSSGSITF